MLAYFRSIHLGISHLIKSFVFLISFFLPLIGISQWVQKSNGINGGAVSSLVTIDDVFFASTNAGIFKSSDNAATWHAANNGIRNWMINDLIKVGDVLYTATNGGGCFKSEDEGASWSLIEVPSIYAILYLANLGDKVYLMSNLGEIFSYNTKAGTMTKLTGPDNANSLSVTQSKIFVGTSNGLYSSSNEGQSWNLVSTGFSNNITTLDADAGGTSLFVWASDKVITSLDNGVNWHDTGLARGYYGVTFFEGKIRAVKSNQTNVSGDGVSWTTINSTVDDIIRKPNGLYGTTSDGVVYSSDEGTSWTLRNIGIIAGWMQSLVVKGDMIFTSSGSYIYGSSNGGSSWSDMSNGIPHNNLYVISAMAVSGNNIIASTLSGLYLSKDNGMSWSLVDGPSGTYRFASVRDNLYASDNSTVYVSKDHGANWSVFVSLTYIFNIFGAGDYLFVSEFVSGNGKLTRFLPNGESVDVTKGIELKSGQLVDELTVFDGKIFCNALGLFSSEDYGAHWQKITLQGEYNSSNGLGYLSVVETMAAKDDIIYASFLGGHVYATKTGGDFWIPYNTGFPVLTSNLSGIISLAVSGNQLFAATEAWGIWAIDVVKNPVGNEAVITGNISSYFNERIQLYPNPTTESLNVKLPGEGLKQLVVYSSNGKSVEQLSTSNDQVNITTTSYESGIYLVRVLSGNKYYTDRFVKK